MFLIWLTILVPQVLPSVLHHPSNVTNPPNRILSINTKCDWNNMEILLKLEKKFNGLIFARDFPKNCMTTNVANNQTNEILLNLPTDGCGIRLKNFQYELHVIVQHERHLQQMTDLDLLVHCQIDKMALRAMDVTGRMARMEHGDGGEMMVKNARAWLEIGDQNGVLRVGEMATLAVRTTLPRTIGFHTINCFAHDGLGDGLQRLLDENGCPIDPSIMPELQMADNMNEMAPLWHPSAYAQFPAFKFPDRERLHITCHLVLCLNNCPKIDCGAIYNRTARHLFEKAILDRLKVFNSVRVMAPEIDDPRGAVTDKLNASPIGNLALIDRTVCVSPDKMALAFCVLGLIFLGAICMTAYALYKARRTKFEGPFFYTQSLFSTSSDCSLFDNKMASTINQSRRINYGRIL